MAQDISTITRRSMVAGLALSASAITTAGPNTAYAEAQTTSDKSLYERLGGVFAIAAVVDHFSDAVVKNPIVGQKSKNPQLREWHTKNLERLPGLKFMRTLWVCDVSGGPFKFTATKPGTTPLGLEEAHRKLRISPAEFDEVAAELGRTLDFFKVPKREKAEVLAAFAAHKDEVTAGYVENPKRG
jgi:hemoglobin